MDRCYKRGTEGRRGVHLHSINGHTLKKKNSTRKNEKPEKGRKKGKKIRMS